MKSSTLLQSISFALSVLSANAYIDQNEASASIVVPPQLQIPESKCRPDIGAPTTSCDIVVKPVYRGYSTTVTSENTITFVEPHTTVITHYDIQVVTMPIYEEAAVCRTTVEVPDFGNRTFTITVNTTTTSHVFESTTVRKTLTSTHKVTTTLPCVLEMGSVTGLPANPGGIAPPSSGPTPVPSYNDTAAVEPPSEGSNSGSYGVTDGDETVLHSSDYGDSD